MKYCVLIYDILEIYICKLQALLFTQSLKEICYIENFILQMAVLWPKFLLIYSYSKLKFLLYKHVKFSWKLVLEGS